MQQDLTTIKRRSAARLLGALPAAALVAVLAGCASPAGIEPQARPLDGAEVGLAGTEAAPAISLEWWRELGDAQLDRLVERALQDHPDLKVAQARLARAAAGVEGADAARWPQVNGSLDLTRQRYTENGAVPAPLAGSIRNSATLQLSGGWELDFFGRHRAQLEAALGARRAAQAEVAAARVVLAANVVRQYVQLGRLFEQRAIAERTLAQRQEMLELVRQRVAAGLDTQVELRQGEGALPEIRQQIESLDEQIALARHALAALTAQAPGALDDLRPALPALRDVPAPQQLPADLLGRRPDVEAARWRVEAAARDVQVARTEFYPNVNLTAFVGLSSIGLDRLLEAGSRQYGAGPALRLPVFEAGRLRAQLRGRTADLDAAIESYNAAVLGAVRDVADQLASRRSVERQLREQQQAQAAAEAAYDYAVQRYRAGLGSYLTVLTAEQAVLAQRRLGADLKARTLDTHIALMRALGGGHAADATLVRR